MQIVIFVIFSNTDQKSQIQTMIYILLFNNKYPVSTATDKHARIDCQPSQQIPRQPSQQILVCEEWAIIIIHNTFPFLKIWFAGAALYPTLTSIVDRLCFYWSWHCGQYSITESVLPRKSYAKISPTLLWFPSAQWIKWSFNDVTCKAKQKQKNKKHSFSWMEIFHGSSLPMLTAHPNS